MKGCAVPQVRARSLGANLGDTGCVRRIHDTAPGRDRLGLVRASAILALSIVRTEAAPFAHVLCAREGFLLNRKLLTCAPHESMLITCQR